MHALAALSETPAGTTLSSLLGEYERYVASGEINTVVADAPAAIEAVRRHFSTPGYTSDELDGLTVVGPDAWFNVRPSNTEPLLRLNVEGDDEPAMVAARDQVLNLIRSDAS